MVNIYEEKLENGWTLFRMSNVDMDVAFLDYGCTIIEINIPNKVGVKENVVLAYENIHQYKKNPLYLGAVIGRVAGRIKDATFQMGQNTYDLEQNESLHHLHGGNHALHNTIWNYEIKKLEDRVHVIFSLTMKDGNNGYPGNVSIKIIYSLTDCNQFNIQYEAHTDERTPLTLTNHSYFNLSGNIQESIGNHHVQMNADRHLYLDKDLIAKNISEIQSNSLFDFQKGRTLKDGLDTENEQLLITGNGYDHYFMFGEDASKEIIVTHEQSGRQMMIKTDEPGVVMYTMNGVDEPIPLQFGLAEKHIGVCFETQKPAASLWLKELPSIILNKDEKYEQTTSFQFIVKKS